MHISEGVLAPAILYSGWGLSVAGTGLGLSRLKNDRLMAASLLSAAFFVASLIHVQVGVSAVHLMLNGLLGVILGWVAFPAVLVGLFLQALLFQYGGIAVLGVNTFNMALPPIICWLLFRPLLSGREITPGRALFFKAVMALPAALIAYAPFYLFPSLRASQGVLIATACTPVPVFLLMLFLVRSQGALRWMAAFSCGFLAIFLSSLLTALSLALMGEAFFTQATILVLAHTPVMVLEGFITAFAVLFLAKVSPELLQIDLALSPEPTETPNA